MSMIVRNILRPIVLKIPMMLVITLKIVSLKITLITMTLISLKISLVLKALVMTGIEIPLVVETLVHSILVLMKILVPVLNIMVLRLIKSGWSEEIVGTIA